LAGRMRGIPTATRMGRFRDASDRLLKRRSKELCLLGLVFSIGATWISGAGAGFSSSPTCENLRHLNKGLSLRGYLSASKGKQKATPAPDSRKQTESVQGLQVFVDACGAGGQHAGTRHFTKALSSLTNAGFQISVVVAVCTKDKTTAWRNMAGKPQIKFFVRNFRTIPVDGAKDGADLLIKLYKQTAGEHNLIFSQNPQFEKLEKTDLGYPTRTVVKDMRKFGAAEAKQLQSVLTRSPKKGQTTSKTKATKTKTKVKKNKKVVEINCAVVQGLSCTKALAARRLVGPKGRLPPDSQPIQLRKLMTMLKVDMHGTTLKEKMASLKLKAKDLVHRVAQQKLKSKKKKKKKSYKDENEKRLADKKSRAAWIRNQDAKQAKRSEAS